LFLLTVFGKTKVTPLQSGSGETGRDSGHQEKREPATKPDGASGAAQMRDSKLFLSEDSVTERPRWRRWRGRALIFGLISASTAALLLCPCDCPGQNPHAISLIALSILIGAGAALLIYRELRRRSDITAFLKSAIAVGIVAFAVYAEFTVAMDLIVWLARRGR
jgi:hypothetical protein